MSLVELANGDYRLTHSLTAEQSRIYLALSPEQQEQFRRTLEVAVARWSRDLLTTSLLGGAPPPEPGNG